MGLDSIGLGIICTWQRLTFAVYISQELTNFTGSLEVIDTV